MIFYLGIQNLGNNCNSQYMIISFAILYRP